MAEIKWIKLSLSMFDDETMKIIDCMPERGDIYYIWIRLLMQAGRSNSDGLIFLKKGLPYTDEMIASVFLRPLDTVRLALNTLIKFRMIEIDEDNFIKITNWEKYQNIDGMNKVREQARLRMQKMRKKRKDLKEKKESVTLGYSDVSVQNKKEDIDIDKDIEIDLDINKNKNINKNKEKVIDKNNNKNLDLDINKNIDQESIEILTYYEKITGTIGKVGLGQ